MTAFMTNRTGFSDLPLPAQTPFAEPQDREIGDHAKYFQALACGPSSLRPDHVDHHGHSCNGIHCIWLYVDFLTCNEPIIQRFKLQFIICLNNTW